MGASEEQIERRKGKLLGGKGRGGANGTACVSLGPCVLGQRRGKWKGLEEGEKAKWTEKDEGGERARQKCEDVSTPKSLPLVWGPHTLHVSGHSSGSNILFTVPGEES